MTETTDLSKRHIRSYVLRQGRVSVAQQRAIDTWLPRYGIPHITRQIDLDQAFGRKASKVMEIGFGMGDSTATIAAAHPEIDYLALEVHTPGVGNLLKLIDLEQLNNIRIMQHDAVEVLRDMICANTLDGVHIFFPDPWHKARHHKRRLVQPAFVSLLASRLAPGATLHCATDWEPYAAQMLEVLSAEPELVNTAEGFAARPALRPLTKFENRGLGLGHGVWDLVFEKR